MPSHKYSYILHEYVILNSLGYLLRPRPHEDDCKRKR